MTRPCLPSQHRWRIADVLPMGLPDRTGWYTIVLRRVCRLCAYGEAWAAEQSLAKRRVIILKEE